MDVWAAVIDGLYELQVVANSVAQNKPKVEWAEDYKKNVLYDLKVRNILIFSLEVNEYHSVCHY